MINIVIAEDHNIIINGMDFFFEFKEDINIIGKVNDGSALLEFLEQRNRHVNIVIVDIRMPKLDGIEATKYITANYPHIKVIALTMYRKREIVNKMIAAGAKGYLLKNVSLPILSKAVRAVYSGETYFDPDLSLDNENSTVDIKKESLLTKRQNEILDLIGQHFNNKEIAKKLFISEHTVGTHRKNMIEKLNLKGRDSLLTYALNRNYDFD